MVSSSLVRCPHCKAWLNADSKSVWLLNLGAFIMLAGAVTLLFVPKVAAVLLTVGLAILVPGMIKAQRLIPADEHTPKQ